MKTFMKFTFIFIFCLIGTPFIHAGMNGTDKKIIEIKKIINLSEEQENKIRSLHVIYTRVADSALIYVKDPIVGAQMKYDANKVFHEAFMNILSEGQRNRYIYVTSTPEINAKTEMKINILQETGTYTNQEIEKIRKEIFDYLMKEKIVYVREKYNIKKQKQNISQLKKHQPHALKEANAQEKLKHNGKPHSGRYQW